MLSKKMEKALNDQINAEFYSAFLYLSMAAHFDAAGMSGFANWMRVQFQEEQAHAMKLFGYVSERGGRVKLAAIDAPKASWKTTLAVFEETYKHEQKVTGLINKLVDLARAESDHATDNFLQWFVAEQVEEEASAAEILQRVKMIGDGNGLYMLDRELAQRVYTPPASEKE